MVIDMNETQVRTLEQVRQVVAGTQSPRRNLDQPDGSFCRLDLAEERAGLGIGVMNSATLPSSESMRARAIAEVPS
jgi:hypothetical protein